MKKSISILLIVLARTAIGQVTLENIYPNALVTKHFEFIRIDSNEYKYALFNPQNSQFTLYNPNHSVFLNVSIPITYTGSSQYQIAFVTKSLFDCDTSNIEYALSFLGDGAPYTYPKRLYVYRTDGTQLANIDSCCFINYSDGWKYGPEYNKPIVNTPTGSKLLLRCLDGSARVYSVCGTLPTLIADNNDENLLGNAFPNPTKGVITIPYSLPANEKSGLIKIYDMNGSEIKSYVVDNNFGNVTVTTDDLASGSYYYQLITLTGQANAKKIIRIE